MKFINPLCWPTSRPRTNKRVESRFREFKSTPFDLKTELRLLNAKNIRVTCDMELFKYGSPKQTQPTTQDPGIAIYFTLQKKPVCMAFDKYKTGWENLAAAVFTIRALRGLDRWGGSDLMHEAFRGFEALPEPQEWRSVLEIPVGLPVDLRAVKQAYREKARKHHPDMGGSNREMQEINLAYFQAMEEVNR